MEMLKNCFTFKNSIGETLLATKFDHEYVITELGSGKERCRESEHAVKHQFDNKIWTNIEEAAPEKFKFIHKHSRRMYTACKSGDSYLVSWSNNDGFESDGSTEYFADSVIDCIDCGTWIIVEDVDGAVTPQEIPQEDEFTRMAQFLKTVHDAVQKHGLVYRQTYGGDNTEHIIMYSDETYTAEDEEGVLKIINLIEQLEEFA
jgi:hypothetical protein